MGITFASVAAPWVWSGLGAVSKLDLSSILKLDLGVSQCAKELLQLHVLRAGLQLIDSHFKVCCTIGVAAALWYVHQRHERELALARRASEPLATQLRREADRRYYAALLLIAGSTAMFAVGRFVLELRAGELNAQKEALAQEHERKMKELKATVASLDNAHELALAKLQKELAATALPLDNLIEACQKVGKLTPGTSHILWHNTSTSKELDLDACHPWG